MNPGAITPAIALAHVAPEILDSLSDLERALLPYFWDLWLRPNQRISYDDNWRTYGFIGGRGFGKSAAIAPAINYRVEYGLARHVGLMAPTEKRCEEVQIAFLIDTAPPWFRPERYKDGLIWPNGVRAVTFTPEQPGRPRSENIELSWLCEIVDWQASTRVEAFNNMMTATRVGRAQVLWDTTSKGKNEVILGLLEAHARDPEANRLQRGTTFDNPLLGRKYLESTCALYPRGSRGYREEILGEVFAESAGALWEQAWLDAYRAQVTPPLVHRVVAVDPAGTNTPESDETGIVSGGIDARGEVFVDADLSGRLDPNQWGDIAVAECIDGDAAGALVETNRNGDACFTILQSRARERRVSCREGSSRQADPSPPARCAVRQRGVHAPDESGPSRGRRERDGARARASRRAFREARTRAHDMGARREGSALAEPTRRFRVCRERTPLSRDG